MKSSVAEDVISIPVLATKAGIAKVDSAIPYCIFPLCALVYLPNFELSIFVFPRCDNNLRGKITSRQLVISHFIITKQVQKLSKKHAKFLTTFSVLKF
jgi:hypothetical protein